MQILHQNAVTLPFALLTLLARHGVPIPAHYVKSFDAFAPLQTQALLALLSVLKNWYNCLDKNTAVLYPTPASDWQHDLKNIYHGLPSAKLLRISPNASPATPLCHGQYDWLARPISIALPVQSMPLPMPLFSSVLPKGYPLFAQNLKFQDGSKYSWLRFPKTMPQPYPFPLSALQTMLPCFYPGDLHSTALRSPRIP
ncbi:hypothetical protein SDC9_154785 [bioreactor metagenome]|uniref:Uncharacterized protein n=1 Tax=bioreactor metagenome TaxID=1076179 RepID=A0A645EZN1_9ZZZZ